MTLLGTIPKVEGVIRMCRELEEVGTDRTYIMRLTPESTAVFDTADATYSLNLGSNGVGMI